MKITGLKTYIVDPGTGGSVPRTRKNLIFVKVETDTGIYGWGESYTQSDRDSSTAAHITELGRHLEGRDPFNIKHFTQVSYEDFAHKRGGMDFWCAVSGIEHALWDIVGKTLNVPIYKLLGGACRDRIKVYANGWSDALETPKEYADAAKKVVQRGFTALKFDPFQGPWRLWIKPDMEKKAVETVRSVREAVGPDVDIMVEGHRRLAPMHAIKIIKDIEPYRPFWYEEPCPAENLDALAEVRHATQVPIMTGETLYTKSDFRQVFEKRAADIINPDVCNTGGILELKEIAAMAEPHLIAVSPHNFNSVGIGLAATLQASATMPNFLITEYFINMEPFVHKIVDEPFVVKNGYIQLPDKPGLGIDIKEDDLTKYSPTSRAPRHIREVHEEGP